MRLKRSRLAAVQQTGPRRRHNYDRYHSYGWDVFALCAATIAVNCCAKRPAERVVSGYRSG